MDAEILIREVFGNPAVCKGCGADIFWCFNKRQKRVPFEADGTNHFATCPNADDFRKPRTAPPRTR